MIRYIQIPVIISLFLSSYLFADLTTSGDTAKKAGADPSKVVKKKLSPQEDKLQKQLTDLFEKSKHVNSKDKAKRKIARKALETTMDWDKVAMVCLGESVWKKQSAKNRKAFRDLLKEVIVRTAYGRIDSLWEKVKEYKFTEVKVNKGRKGYAASEFFMEDESFVLEYYLSKKGNKWLVDDLAYEEMRYSENINEQISAFFKDKGFSELMKRIRKRRDDLRSEQKNQ